MGPTYSCPLLGCRLGHVEVRDRITTFGVYKTITFAQPNTIGLVLFDGTQGQRVSLDFSDTGITGLNCNLVIELYAPDGSRLARQQGGLCGDFIDAQTLPYTGAYTVAVTPQGGGTGSVSIRVFDVPPDLTGTLTPNGPAVNLNIVTGQRAQLT